MARSLVLSAWSCAVLVALLFTLAGCVTPNEHADAIAQPAGLRREQITTHDFVLTAFSRINQLDAPITIYIEGDGLAWHSRTEPSDDPTPHHAVGLMLAAADPSANVVYLARPCQFTPMKLNPRCSAEYWTSRRFSEAVVATMDEAISAYAFHTPGKSIHLVGYSGGGALAVLIAARRNDMASLRTVVGNLDHVAVNRINKVSAMPASLNAIDYARQVANIPQIHFSGADDSVVPPNIAQRFATAAGRCAQARIISGMSHGSAWGRLWPKLLTSVPSCSPDNDHE